MLTEQGRCWSAVQRRAAQTEATCRAQAPSAPERLAHLWLALLFPQGSKCPPALDTHCFQCPQEASQANGEGVSLSSLSPRCPTHTEGPAGPIEAPTEQMCLLLLSLTPPHFIRTLCMLAGQSQWLLGPQVEEALAELCPLTPCQPILG